MLNGLLLITAAGGLLPLGARWWWVFELTSHFRLQYIVAAGVVLVIALAFRRRALAAAVAVAMIVNAIPLFPYLPFPDRAEASATGYPLAILNINVNAGNTEYAAILDTIRESRADVVALTELSHALAARLDSISDIYPHRITVPTDDNFGIAVLSRHAFEADEVFRLGPTSAIAATLAIPDRRFTFLAVHALPPQSGAMAAARNGQLELLADRISATPAPVVACGDFNLSPYSPHFAQFESQSGTTSARRGHGIGMSWPATAPWLGTAIDHCFLKGGFVTESVERMDRTGSDHYPVRVSLRLF